MQNRKGMGIVTVLAFLALALILFAGMVITFQSSSARESKGFDHQQVLLMAQSYSQLIEDKLSTDKELIEGLMRNKNKKAVLINNSNIKDIYTTVEYNTDSLNCFEENSSEGTIVTETCTLPIEFETTSTLKRSTGEESRTIKSSTEIKKVTQTITGVSTEVHKYLGYALVTDLRGREIKTIDGKTYIVKNKHKNLLFGETISMSDFSSFGVSPIDGFYSKSCSANITDSCKWDDALIAKDVTIKATSTNGGKPIFIVIDSNDEINGKSININVEKNQSVIFYLKGNLTLKNTDIKNDPNSRNEGLVLIMSDEAKELSFTGDSGFEGMVYLPKGTVNDDVQAESKESFILGVVITSEFKTPKSSKKEGLSFIYAPQNLGNLCIGENYCPFGTPGESTGGETIVTTTYSSGGLKYAK